MAKWTTPDGAREPVRIEVERLAHAEDLPLPAYQSAQAAGLDLLAAIPADKPQTLHPGQRLLVPTGLQIALPKGYEGQVRPRSGLALRFGITVLNSPGTIDSDYRGEVSVVLINLGETPFEIRRGERIAQLVVAPVSLVTLIEVAALDGTARGAGGYGSTGVAAVATAKDQPPPPQKANRSPGSGRSAQKKAPTKR